MSNRNIFSEMQLEELGTPLSIRLERAAGEQDRSEIDTIRSLMDQECTVIYNSYMTWIGVLETFILQNAGELALHDALRYASEYSFRPFVRSFKGLSPRNRAIRVAQFLRASGSTFTVEEDGEKIRFNAEVWGGVSRHWRYKEGSDEGLQLQRRADQYLYPLIKTYDLPGSFVPISTPSGLTHGVKDLPCLLAVEVLLWEILAIEELGMPIAAITLPDTPEAPAILDVYKAAQYVPERVFERVSMAVHSRSDFCEDGKAFEDNELRQLGTPLSIQVEQLAETEDWDKLFDITQNMDEELVYAKDPLGILIAGLLTWIARHLGEDQVEKALKRTAEVVMTPYIELVRDMDPATSLQTWAMVFRAHGSTFWIEEDQEKFLFRGRPLGACHRMWSHSYQEKVERISDSRVRYPTFGCYDPPGNFHVLREARGCTAMKEGYPVYSAHCHMLHEIYPIDLLGYPLWVEIHPLHDKDGETIHVRYKDPADWPEKYYTQLGRSKKKMT